MRWCSRVLFLLVACVPFALAQPTLNPNPFTCVANAGVPPIVRTEGLTELVGDIVLNCTGGQPTPLGQTVPKVNLKLLLNTDVTSRLLAGNASEALLLIDEPKSSEEWNICLPTTQCEAKGTGNGQFVYGLNLAPNVYQAQLFVAKQPPPTGTVSPGSNAVEWEGVPIDAPGTTGVRLIRLTNVRANAAPLSVASTLVPNQIVAYISITSTASGAPIFNASQIAAYLNRAPAVQTLNGGHFGFNTPATSSFKVCEPPPSITGSSPAFTVQINSGVPGAVKPPGGPISSNDGSTESGTGDQSKLPGVGNADTGAILQVDITRVGLDGTSGFDNVQFGVPNQLAINPTGSLNLLPGSNVTPLPGTSQSVVNPVNGFARFQYQASQIDPSKLQNINVPVRSTWAVDPPGGSTFIAFPALARFVPGGIPDGKDIPEFIAVDNILPVQQVTQCTGGSGLTVLADLTNGINVTRNDGTPRPLRTQLVTVSKGQTSIPFKVDAMTSTGQTAAHTSEPRKSVSLVQPTWLTVSSTANQTPATVSIVMYPQGLPAKVYSGTVHITATDGSGQVVAIPVNLTIAGNPPTLPSAGVVNAATGKTGAISPGELLVFYGDRFGPDSLVYTPVVAPPPQLYTETASSRVFFNGIPAPMVYATKGQIAAVVPYEIAGESEVETIVEYKGNWSVPINLPVADASPGFFTADSSGKGQAAALNLDGSANSAANPAARNSFLILYGTGEGLTNPAGVSGKLADANQTHPVLPVTVNIGGIDVTPDYAGSAVGLVEGIMQINIRVPAGVTPGSAVPIKVRVGDQVSPDGVTAAIK